MYKYPYIVLHQHTQKNNINNDFCRNVWDICMVKNGNPHYTCIYFFGKSMHLQGVDWSLFAYYRGVHKRFVKGPLPLQKTFLTFT